MLYIDKASISSGLKEIDRKTQELFEVGEGDKPAEDEVCDQIHAAPEICVISVALGLAQDKDYLRAT